MDEVPNAPGGDGARVAATDGWAVNVNRAPKEALEKLAMVGPKRARALVQYRPHYSWDEIEQIPGFDRFVAYGLQREGAYLGPSPKVGEGR